MNSIVPESYDDYQEKAVFQGNLDTKEDKICKDNGRHKSIGQLPTISRTPETKTQVKYIKSKAVDSSSSVGMKKKYNQKNKRERSSSIRGQKHNYMSQTTSISLKYVDSNNHKSNNKSTATLLKASPSIIKQRNNIDNLSVVQNPDKNQLNTDTGPVEHPEREVLPQLQIHNDNKDCFNIENSQHSTTVKNGKDMNTINSTIHDLNPDTDSFRHSDGNEYYSPGRKSTVVMNLSDKDKAFEKKPREECELGRDTQSADSGSLHEGEKNLNQVDIDNFIQNFNNGEKITKSKVVQNSNNAESSEERTQQIDQVNHFELPLESLHSFVPGNESNVDEENIDSLLNDNDSTYHSNLLIPTSDLSPLKYNKASQNSSPLKRRIGSADSINVHTHEPYLGTGRNISARSSTATYKKGEVHLLRDELDRLRGALMDTYKGKPKLVGGSQFRTLIRHGNQKRKCHDCEGLKTFIKNLQNNLARIQKDRLATQENCEDRENVRRELQQLKENNEKLKKEINYQSQLIQLKTREIDILKSEKDLKNSKEDAKENFNLELQYKYQEEIKALEEKHNLQETKNEQEKKVLVEEIKNLKESMNNFKSRNNKVVLKLQNISDKYCCDNANMKGYKDCSASFQGKSIMNTKKSLYDNSQKHPRRLTNNRNEPKVKKIYKTSAQTKNPILKSNTMRNTDDQAKANSKKKIIDQNNIDENDLLDSDKELLLKYESDVNIAIDNICSEFDALKDIRKLYEDVSKAYENLKQEESQIKLDSAKQQYSLEDLMSQINELQSRNQILQDMCSKEKATYNKESTEWNTEKQILEERIKKKDVAFYNLQHKEDVNINKLKRKVEEIAKQALRICVVAPTVTISLGSAPSIEDSENKEILDRQGTSSNRYDDVNKGLSKRQYSFFSQVPAQREITNFIQGEVLPRFISIFMEDKFKGKEEESGENKMDLWLSKMLIEIETVVTAGINRVFLNNNI